MERETGLEPATSSLGSWATFCLTSEPEKDRELDRSGVNHLTIGDKEDENHK
jgi:hypothetical protein